MGGVDQKYCEVPMPGGVAHSEFTHFHEFIVCDELSRTGSGGVTPLSHLLVFMGSHWGTRKYKFTLLIIVGLPPVLQFGSDYLKDKVLTR